MVRCSSGLSQGAYKGKNMFAKNIWTTGLIPAAMFCLPLIASPALACNGTRHFYNHTDDKVTITMFGKATCSIGSSGNIQKCDIPSGQTGELHWPELTEQPSSISMESRHFTLSYGVDASYCRLEHQGNTGNVVLNDPANGDVQTCGRVSGGGYDCSK